MSELIIGLKDHLTDRYNELALMADIPDMQTYADAWKLLGEQAEAEDRPALAVACFSRADYYGSYTGNFIRVVDGSFAELIAQ